MVVPVGTAINAYNNTANNLAGQTLPSAAGDAAGGASFGSFLSDAVSSTIGSLHNSEDVSTKALVGKASTNDVVMAVSQAEVNLKEFVKIRDEVISAYQDIIKMPI